MEVNKKIAIMFLMMRVAVTISFACFALISLLDDSRMTLVFWGMTATVMFYFVLMAIMRLWLAKK